MPDDKTIRDERFRCAEAFFKPDLFCKDSCGIHETIFNSIMNCGAVIHKDLFGHVVLANGSSLFPGIAERMQKEMSALASPRRSTSLPRLSTSSLLGSAVP